MLKRFGILLAAGAAFAFVLANGALHAREFGSNWTAQYYDNPNLSGTPRATQVVNQINFRWGEGDALDDVGLPEDDFSARFTGTQTFAAGTYEFVVTSDDGVRVIIDGATVLDRFVSRPETTDRFTQTFATAGARTIIVEYFENEGDATIQFQWFAVGGQQPIPGATPVPLGPTPTVGPPPPTPLPQIPEGALAGTVIRAQVLLVRDAPFFAGNVIGRIRRGQTYQIVGRDPDARWYLVQLSGFQGWVYGYYVFVNGNEFNAPIVSAFTVQGGAATGAGVVGQAVNGLRLRAAPTTESEQIGRINPGDLLAVLGRNAAGDWYQVVFKNTTGWVYSPYVKIVEGDINAVPVF
jgi:uncharacterized protein YraI